jgi:hypothetical protein
MYKGIWLIRQNRYIITLQVYMIYIFYGLLLYSD